MRGWEVVVLMRLGLTAPPISWLKGRLVAEEAAEEAGGVLLAASLLPVAGMEPVECGVRESDTDPGNSPW